MHIQNAQQQFMYHFKTFFCILHSYFIKFLEKMQLITIFRKKHQQAITLNIAVQKLRTDLLMIF